MSVFKSLFLLFLLVPVVEIYFLITVGSVIGAWFTVFLVIATAIIGAFFVRQQGISTLFRLQNELQQDKVRPEHSAVALLEGVAILIAGVLLLTPGFLTDAIGFICLVPPWRRGLIHLFLPRPDYDLHAQTWDQQHSRKVIEGNFRREDE
ncbi:MAG: FxsA family protein [Gammaproteobacteria bacterium]|nr:FxsA family protein [Gammaproteobacteria bacterium]NNJ83721.1 FxsA family protein [Gammaproteobacteria bacterium]